MSAELWIAFYETLDACKSVFFPDVNHPDYNFMPNRCDLLGYLNYVEMSWRSGNYSGKYTFDNFISQPFWVCYEYSQMINF